MRKLRRSGEKALDGAGNHENRKVLLEQLAAEECLDLRPVLEQEVQHDETEEEAGDDLDRQGGARDRAFADTLAAGLVA